MFVLQLPPTESDILIDNALFRHALRDKDALILKQDSAIRELSVKPISIVFETNSSQTEVDDDGLWDAQVRKPEGLLSDDLSNNCLLIASLASLGRNPTLRVEKRASQDALEAL